MIIIANSFANGGTRPCFIVESNVYLSSLRFILFPAQLLRCVALRHVAREYQFQKYCNVLFFSKREICLFSDFYMVECEKRNHIQIITKKYQEYYMTYYIKYYTKLYQIEL